MTVKRTKVLVKRVYAEAEKKDGFRILVDRLWPRGLKKEHAAIHEWLRDIGPSHELRRWFHDDSKRWEEFKERYSKELALNRAQTGLLLALIKKHGKVTLLYGAKDAEFNNAQALRQILGL